MSEPCVWVSWQWEPSYPGDTSGLLPAPAYAASPAPASVSQKSGNTWVGEVAGAGEEARVGVEVNIEVEVRVEVEARI